MSEFITTARLEAGALKLRNEKAWTEWLRAQRDGEYLVRIGQHHATRSIQANRFYWGVVVQAVAEHTGYTPEETHDVLKQMFLPKKLAMCDGNGEVCGEFVIGGSTTRLNTVEFSEYVTRVKQFAEEQLGLIIPSPQEVAA